MVKGLAIAMLVGCGTFEDPNVVIVSYTVTPDVDSKPASA